MTAIRKFNIVLIVLVVLLAASNLLLTEKNNKPVSDIATEQISTIEINAGEITFGSKIMAFNKTNNLWVLRNDDSIAIDQDKIKKLLDILNTHSFRQFENTQENRVAFKLEDSKNYYLLNNKKIVFGTLDPVDQNRYVLFDNQIHLITDYYYQFLLADIDFFKATAK